MNINMFNAQRKIWHGSGIIERNFRLTEQTFRLTLVTQGVLPTVNAGQFVMLRLPNRTDPLLGRPFAVYRVLGNVLEVIYLVVGKMTEHLAKLRSGDMLDFWVPLGNGFSPVSTPTHIIMVAGGIGQTPFLMLAEKYFRTDSRCTLLYGTRNAKYVIGMDDFRQFDVDIHLATDDGSCNEGFINYHGPVTDLISKVYRHGEPARIFCCGPRPMLHAAFRIASRFNLPCEVSLETSMSCGLGICFGCVVKCRCEKEKTTDKEIDLATKIEKETWDYRRTCIDGPVFDAYRLCW
ncbi:MAG: dihydroorotate dehydrogenase electron transfer subunit [Planctomycetaceae bacterium]|nr:dihydroorotate dehydrogenase electron transfer subunit [Planctomycetaceae bacterium]